MSLRRLLADMAAGDDALGALSTRESMIICCRTAVFGWRIDHSSPALPTLVMQSDDETLDYCAKAREAEERALHTSDIPRNLAQDCGKLSGSRCISGEPSRER